MNWNEFEKRVADGLNDYQSPIDVEATMKAIREKEKKKKGLIWFFFLPLFGLTLMGYFLIGMGSRNTTLVRSEGKQPQIQSEANAIHNSSSIQGTNRSKVSDISQNKTQSTGNESSVIAKNIIASKKSNPSKFSQFKNTQVPHTHKTVDNLSNAEANPVGLTGQSDFSDIVMKQELIKSEQFDLVKMPGLLVDVELKPLVALFNLNADMDQGIKIPKVGMNRFQLDASFGAGIWSYNKARPLYDGTDYGTSFQAREKALNTWDFGVKLAYKLNKNLYIYSGAQFVQLNRFYEYNTSTTSNQTIENTFEGVNNFASGKIDSIYGDVSYLAIENKYIKRHNRVNVIGIPVGLSYKVSFNKWSFEPFIGAQWHCFINETLPVSLAIDPTYNAIEPLINPYTINRFSAEYGINICQNIGINSGIFIELRAWNFIPNSFGNAEFGLNAAGLSTKLGYRYKF